MQLLSCWLFVMFFVSPQNTFQERIKSDLYGEGVVDLDKRSECDEIDEDFEFMVTWFKQSRAFERSMGEVPYIWEYKEMQKAGLVRMPWRNRYYKMSKAVSYEPVCKIVEQKHGGKIRRKRVCNVVFRPRNFIRPLAKQFLDQALPIWFKYNHRVRVQVNSLTRDHKKQMSLMEANYPTAILTPQGYFLSSHLLGNSIDLTDMNRELKTFLYRRFYEPWIDWDPYRKPLIIYFEGRERDENCKEMPYWKRTGAVHIDFPVDYLQFGAAMDLMNATEEELPWVIARIQKKLKDRPLMVISR